MVLTADCAESRSLLALRLKDLQEIENNKDNVTKDCHTQCFVQWLLLNLELWTGGWGQMEKPQS